MRLYHFTGRGLVRGLYERGITPGVAFTGLGDQTVRGVWLTDDPEWGGQQWATVRIPVDVPVRDRRRLLRWTSDGAMRAEFAEGFSRPGYEHWLIYPGHIPSTWLGAASFRPVRVSA